ncbi:aminomethyl-transferring glycine dehydrogenase subunit GcvPA [Yinghuangia seranimata]|uniref:aminomethyl-transferring glycine dehydrogenase subunit GcvPA n=1 Tax=Yinghuangia seranimata TaxID=408067 RepID=UPI00248CE9EB|nr:aminomethyl-transferring glycine dehydrogenase subunit GcvPA [Yinghuangia seranimata]MDI2128473.1 aminomethyl-transferring glycine dehydrogenase subunit GcvPA [Yinghuangia seranimata]
MTHPYIPNAEPGVRAAMLAEIGATSVDDLYGAIPASLRLNRPLDLPAPLASEHELARHMRGLLDRNTDTLETLSFLGGGCYPHHVPAVCDEVNNRGEFLTAYAGEPYEDHGRFQALFEYVSMMAELLEMDVVNVPTYDGFQATGTALRMAARYTGRNRLLVSAAIGADKLSKLRDFLDHDVPITLVPVGEDGETGAFEIDDTVAAVYVESPNAYGVVETRLAAIAEQAHAEGALLVVGADPIALGVLAPPATLGADIVCGDIQSLGMHQSYGGGHAGYIATRDEERLVAEFPSRLFGIAPTAVPGEYGFGDVYYDRTSFALREEGKEWVGTAAALWGITAGVYLALMGPQGMRELGETVLARTRYAMDVLGAVPGVRVLHETAIHFREFAIEVEDAQALLDDLRTDGIYGGIRLDDTTLLVCVTERHAKADIDRLVAAVAAALPVQDHEGHGR